MVHDGGVTAAPGLYLMGMPFLRRRRSTLIDGAGADAVNGPGSTTGGWGREVEWIGQVMGAWPCTDRLKPAATSNAIVRPRMRYHLCEGSGPGQGVAQRRAAEEGAPTYRTSNPLGTLGGTRALSSRALGSVSDLRNATSCRCSSPVNRSGWRSRKSMVAAIAWMLAASPW